MRHLLILVIIAAFGLHSCKVGTSGTWKDDDIEQSLKKDIQALDEKVLEAVVTQNANLLKSIMSDQLLEKSDGDMDQLIKQVASVITTTDYEILNQFQTKNSTTEMANTILTGASGLNDYIIRYQALNEEMFISLLISKSGLDEFMVTNIYGKYPDGWKLNILQFGQYKIDGQTAPELFTKAKNKFDKGYLVDAANTMYLCSKVSNPGNELWQYHKEGEMRSLQEKIMSKINAQYSFPLTLEEIESKPKILTIYPQEMQEGHFPMIEYLTSIDLKDTVGTKAENEKIHNMIGQTFSGIDQDKKYIFYKAFGQIPDGKTPVPAYGFVREFK